MRKRRSKITNVGHDCSWTISRMAVPDTAETSTVKLYRQPKSKNRSVHNLSLKCQGVSISVQSLRTDLVVDICPSHNVICCRTGDRYLSR